MRRLATPAGWRGRADPLVVGCGIVAAIVYVLHGYDGSLSRDVAVYAYGGQRVADGVLPYVGLVNRAGPLAHLVPGLAAIAAGLLDVDDLTAMRVLYTALSAAAVSVTYALGRDLFGSRLTGLAAAAALLSFYGFIDYATYGPREKTLMVFFLLAALLAMRHQRWATTGFLVSLATLTWQPVFPAAILGVVVAVGLGLPTGRVAALLRVAVGGLAPALVTVAVYAVFGALRKFLDAFLLINARYTQGKSFAQNPRGNVRDLVDGFGSSLAVLLLGLVVLLVLGIQVLASREQRREPAGAAVAGCAAAAVGSVGWTLMAFNSWPDALLLVPFGAVGIGGLAGFLVERLPTRAAATAVLAWTVVGCLMATTYAVGARDTSLREQRRDTAAVLATLPPGSQILSIAAPEPLVLSRQVHPGRYQLFGNGLADYLEDTREGGMTGYGQWVGEQEAPVIAVGARHMPVWLAPELKGTYAKVGQTSRWRWYVRRDVGTGTLAALRTALR